jgi:hypothetical protein
VEETREQSLARTGLTQQQDGRKTLTGTPMVDQPAQSGAHLLDHRALSEQFVHALLDASRLVNLPRIIGYHPPAQMNGSARRTRPTWCCQRPYRIREHSRAQSRGASLAAARVPT